MKERCYNPNNKAYKNYGGRGITVCARWDSFENFLADMGKRPGKHLSLERKDVNGPYSQANCIWATPKAQNNNQRRNNRITINGVTKNLCEWLVETGTARSTYLYRKRQGYPTHELFGKLPWRRSWLPNRG